jgi:hypothetical protein
MRNNMPSFFESLERRVLLATVNVSDFGAVPNDGRDDRAAIQNAINASAGGDVINFGAGEYTIGATIKLRGDRQYIGNSTTLKWAGGADRVMEARYVSNLTIKGFTSDGAGFKLEGTKNLTFTENTVKNVTTGDAWVGNGLLILHSMADSTVTRNTFRNIGHRGIYFFNPTRSKFEDNLFEDCYQPVAGSFHTQSENVSFSYNTARGSKRHGIELQNYGVTRGLLVEGNLLEKWADGRPAWSSHMAISAAMGHDSAGMIIRNNVMIADGAIPHMLATGVPHLYFTAIEAMGKGFTIENNHAEGWGWYQLVGHNDPHWVTRNNTWLGTPRTPVRDRIGPYEGDVITPEHGWTGGPAVRQGNFLGMVGDRPRPTAGVRGQTPQPPAPPPPAPSPTPQPPGPQPTEFDWLTDLQWTRARSGWGPVEKDRANGEQRAGDGGPIRIDGRTYERGLGVAINSEVVYNIDRRYNMFYTHVGVDDYAHDRGSVTFQIWADGQKVYDSGILTGRSAGKAVELDVRNVRELKLVTTDAGDGGSYDHASWGGAKLIPAT